MTKERQCVLIEISLKIKMFDFLLNTQNHSRHTSESLKIIVKVFKTRPQSSKNAQKWIKICKIHDVDKSTLLFGFQ